MKANTKRLKKSQKKKLGTMFFKVAAITFSVCLITLGAVAVTYKYFIYQDDEKGGLLKLKPTPKEKDINQTLAVFGVDKDGYRTDVIFVVNYNSQTNKVKVVSVPRDTKVTWTEDQQQKLKEHKGSSISVSKLNEMTSYGGIENIKDFTIDAIENILGITIDNYVVVTIDAFTQIVDAINGVEVDVPTLDGNGLHYDDYAQNLHIHLNPGVQILDGKQAEGLVRYRKGYAEGDVGRIKTQQIFLKAFAKKILNPSILTKLPQIVPVIFTSVKTDMALTEIPQYYTHLKKFDLEYLSFNIIPGEAAHQGSKWYFIPNMDEMKPFTEEIFFDQTIAGAPNETVIEDKTVSIEVLNATSINGAAGKTKDALEKLGYSVARIDNHDTKDNVTTIIYAKDVSLAKQFQSYFTKAVIKLNSDMAYDIQIILGEDIQEGGMTT
ncbi:LCP family protein [Cellulosilyticum sp. I15G10I2]|uniref:LCP family protein n=1 Tax=Cellulosilyticum sp. I15G10I2 TaxID=1892843 RepID=UPI00085C1438|nr:LCP family protein [Cellulosilyticum sp. I15G10I2]